MVVVVGVGVSAVPPHHWFVRLSKEICQRIQRASCQGRSQQDKNSFKTRMEIFASFVELLILQNISCQLKHVVSGSEDKTRPRQRNKISVGANEPRQFCHSLEPVGAAVAVHSFNVELTNSSATGDDKTKNPKFRNSKPARSVCKYRYM